MNFLMKFDIKMVISTEKEYNIALEQIEQYLQKGSQGMTLEDKKALRSLSVLVEAYEQKVYPMPHAIIIIGGYDSSKNV